jgi:NAD(P)-dependent dehydrogenase (short-subunit alcohol dehydrogenase family)
MNDDRKIIVLTGASRGIGHATVKRFSGEGWRVITCSRHGFPENCPWEAGPEDHLQIDLSNEADVLRGAAELLERLNGRPLHALVNNAGISPKPDDGTRLNTINTSMDVWRQVFQVNVFAPVMMTKALIEPLQRGSGAVVNVTSIAGSKVHDFAGSAYATSKAALSGLTREMAADFGRLGIRVNAIAPGEIMTDILTPGSEAAILPQIPLGRFGTPDEVAETIYFLCSDSAKYLNGSEIHINGGQHV